MSIRIPSKKVCKEFYLTYELEGAQRGVNVLTSYYGVPKMKIVLDGRRVANGYEAEYFECIALFTKRGLNKRNVLHELFHHIVENGELEMPLRKEERQAGVFVREVMKKGKP